MHDKTKSVVTGANLSLGLSNRGKKSEDSLPLVMYNQDHVSCEDLLDFKQPKTANSAGGTRKGKTKGQDSDEVKLIFVFVLPTFFY